LSLETQAVAYGQGLTSAARACIAQRLADCQICLHNKINAVRRLQPRKNNPNAELFLAISRDFAKVESDALTTARAWRPESRGASLSGFHAGQGDAAMNNQLSLNTAILSFAFSGMLAPHRREYAAPAPRLPASARKK
jgi:hypothetical protein